MVSINTNLSSLLVQRNLSKSTNALNLAIERMTTGFKINHSSDNAANYSISTNITSKIQSYEVAEENTSMAIDLVETASSNIDLIYSRATRLRELAEQAQNGTYGEASINAINKEAQAIAQEIIRLQGSTEYNGIDLLNIDLTKNITLSSGDVIGIETVTGTPSDAGLSNNVNLTPNAKGFINDIEVRDTSAMTKLSTVSLDTEITSGEYSINSAADLAKLAEMVNSGKVTGGEFVLSGDIDLSDYQVGEGWTPIGNADNQFQSTFDGNGFKITGLKINRQNADEDKQGLFGTTAEGSEIMNVGVIDAEINIASRGGALVGCNNSNITNCYTTGSVTGGNRLGGLIGTLSSTSYIVDSCYSTCDVIGSDVVCGGLIGLTASGTEIKNSYATGSVSGKENVGGLLGYANTNASITNSYATGSVSGINAVGGLVGDSYGTTNGIKNSYSSGDVFGKYHVGGIVGHINRLLSIENCSTSSSVCGLAGVGGIVGTGSSADSSTEVNEEIVKNTYTTGSVTLLGEEEYKTITNGFNLAVQRRDTSSMTALSSIDSTETLSEGIYSISTAAELAQLATMQNAGRIGSACEFVLANDIDLSAYNTGTGWTIIGSSSKRFEATFDGNGYTIDNLFINKKSAGAGLFGYTDSTAVIKNTGLTNVNISNTKQYTGALVGSHYGTVENCWAEGKVKGAKGTGGIVGWGNLTGGSITENCNFTGTVTGTNCVGGINGRSGIVADCYADAVVTGTGTLVGDLVGDCVGVIFNSSSSSGEKVGAAEYAGLIMGSTGRDSLTNVTIENVGYYGEGSSVSDLYRGHGETTATNVEDISSKIQCTFQVGINGDSSSQISVNTYLNVSGLSMVAQMGLEAKNSLSMIDMYLNKITKKQTQLGAAENRLLSASESIGVAYDNLVSSRSTLRDADIAKESSSYIKAQILQQAAATLLSTANQTPSLALQLI